MKSFVRKHRRLFFAVSLGIAITLGILIARTMRGDTFPLLDGVVSFVVGAIFGFILGIFILPRGQNDQS